MSDKSNWCAFLLLGLVLLLTSSLIGCLGVEVVEHEDELDRYWDSTAPLMEGWKAVINDWEESANNPDRLAYLDLDAEDASSRMEDIIGAWDAISPPDKAKEYHLWIHHAMNYEKEAFRVMEEYYRLGEQSDPKEFNRLRNLVTELWVLKDEALLKADAASPK